MTKKLLLVAVSVCLLFFSCVQLTSPTKIENGTITVSLPQAKDVNTSIAAAYSDTFAIIVYNSETTTGAKVTSANPSASITIQPGTFKVLVLAGYDYYFGTCYLLGSGLATNAVVQAGQNTDVTVNLRDIDFTISAPSSVDTGEDFNVTVSGDLKNPVLQIQDNLSVRFGSVTTAYAVNLSTTGSSWEGNATMQAPSSIQDTEITFAPSYQTIRLVDDNYTVSGLIKDYTSDNKNWFLPSTYAGYLDSVAELKAAVSEPISIGTPTPTPSPTPTAGTMGVSLNWVY